MVQNRMANLNKHKQVIEIHEITDGEFLENIKHLEEKHGMSSDEFYHKWLTDNDSLDFHPDGYEFNYWAMLYRQGKELGLL